MAVDKRTPQDSCDTILSAVHSSDLHFLVQESPFSMYITLRKKFTSKSTTTVLQTTSRETDLENKINMASDTIRILEDKLAHAEKELFKESNMFKNKKNELSGEINILKESLKKSQAETSQKSKAVSDHDKNLKVKDKEIHNLEKKGENLVETNKKLKEAITDFKKDQTKSAKNLINVEKKTEKLEQKLKTMEFKLASVDQNHHDENYNSMLSNPTNSSISQESIVIATSTSPTCSPSLLFPFSSKDLSLSSHLWPTSPATPPPATPPPATLPTSVPELETKGNIEESSSTNIFKLECEKLSRLIEDREKRLMDQINKIL